MTDAVTPTEASARFDVPQNVIAQWKARRRITPVGLIPGPGRGGEVPLYRVVELEPLAEAYHERMLRDFIIARLTEDATDDASRKKIAKAARKRLNDMTQAAQRALAQAWEDHPDYSEGFRP